MSAPPTLDKKLIQNLVAQAKLSEALERMSAIASDDDRNTITLLMGRLARNEKDERSGLLSPQQANLTRNQISSAILDLLKRQDDDDDDDDIDLQPFKQLEPQVLHQIREHITHARLSEAIQQFLDSQQDTMMHAEVLTLQNTYHTANNLGGNWHQKNRPNVVKPILAHLESIQNGGQKARRK